ncbi:MAG TPA: right-handed parallel beta-helix repeat-containing protein [Candidatus Limnocylindrales bacterium]|nr:right-handed parallel beta-helix repeat-containing protein [Candidatus Limnocylindrales bacterium]
MKPMNPIAAGAALALQLWNSAPASAVELSVPTDFPTIQAAIDAAPDGAVISVAAGTWFEDIDFAGKDIVVQGEGSDSVIHGTGTGPVVRFTSGEGPGAKLDSFTITGGFAQTGGGIEIVGSSPTIVRNVIAGNSASRVGSGMFIGGASSSPLVANNLMMFNTGAGGDPHTVQIEGSSPRLVNNTIVRNDSNAILTSGEGHPEIRNNILARNGTRINGSPVKGRGICDFAAGTITKYNLFFRNAVAAILTAGKDFRRIRSAEYELQDERLADNLDGATRFSAGRIPRTLSAATPAGFIPREDAPGASRAAHGGDPSPEYANTDGSRNTIGFTGGPFAPLLEER